MSGIYCLSYDCTGNLRVFFKEGGKLFVYHIGNEGTDSGVAELCFCLSLKLSLEHLYRDDAGKTLEHICALKLFFFLYHLVFSCIIIYNTGKRGFKACFMHAALGCVDVICK